MKWLIALILIGSGIAAVISPETIYELSEGWKHKNTNPSDTYLIFTKVMGVVSILAGIIYRVATFINE